MTFDITDLYINTETGLDKVLTANGNDNYRINTPLYGHYHDGAYLYASTMDNSGSSKNTFNEDKKAAELSDKESDFNQEDWVAISDLTSDFVGKKIGSGKVASVIGNSNYPVIKFNEEISTEDSSMDINEFRVENFNIHADNVAVNNIWLVAPQPAEYCSVTGYIDADSTHPEEGYLTLKSAESETISENETIIQPLSLKVYYDPATIILDDNGEYTFYSNMEEIDVNLNDEVVQSQVIGTSTSLGSFDNNHVHFSIINHSGDCVGDIVDKVVCLEE